MCVCHVPTPWEWHRPTWLIVLLLAQFLSHFIFLVVMLDDLGPLSFGFSGLWFLGARNYKNGVRYLPLF